MSGGRTIHVTQRNRGNQKPVQRSGTGQRKLPAADNAALLRLAECRGKARHFRHVFAFITGKRAAQRIEQQVLAAFAHAVGNIFATQLDCEARESPVE